MSWQFYQSFPFIQPREIWKQTVACVNQTLKLIALPSIASNLPKFAYILCLTLGPTTMMLVSSPIINHHLGGFGSILSTSIPNPTLVVPSVQNVSVRSILRAHAVIIVRDDLLKKKKKL